VILEEASRLDEAVFSEVCLPLLGVNNTSLIAMCVLPVPFRAALLTLLQFDSDGTRQLLLSTPPVEKAEWGSSL